MDPTPTKRRKLTPTRSAPGDATDASSPARGLPAGRAQSTEQRFPTVPNALSSESVGGGRSSRIPVAAANRSVPVTSSAQRLSARLRRSSNVEAAAGGSEEDEWDGEATGPRSAPGTPRQPGSAQRASFMSPTKASLARFNPTLLPRPRSAGRSGGSRSPERSGGSIQRQRSLDPGAIGRMLGTESPHESASEMRVRRGLERSRSADARRSEGTQEEDGFGATPASLRSRGTPHRDSVSPIRPESTAATPQSQRLGGGFARNARRPSREPSSLQPASEPRSGVDGEDDGALRTDRLELDVQSPDSAPAGIDPLSSDPLMSGQRDNITSFAPLPSFASDGTPRLSVRPRRPPSSGRLSSPLRPLGIGVGEEPRIIDAETAITSSPMARAAIRHAQPRISPAKERKVKPYVPDIPRMQSAEAVEVSQPTQESQGEDLKEDPEAERKKETLRFLHKRLTAIRSDVQSLKKGVDAMGQRDSVDRNLLEAVIPILMSQDPAHKALTQPPPPSLSSRLACFLPFSRTKPAAPAPTVAETTLLSDAYRPVSLSGSALDYGSSQRVSVNARDEPTETKSSELMRRITLRTSVLNTKLGITIRINPLTTTVLGLSLDSLPAWAACEFGSWAMSAVSAGDAPALGRSFVLYTELDSTRGRTWTRCCKRWSGLVKQLGPITEAGEGIDETNEDEGTTSQPTAKLREVHRGRRSLTFSREGVGIRVEWEIEFDWTGKPQSRVGLVASTPKCWRDADERGALGKLGGAFRKLVSERGVEGAIAVVVGIVFEAA